LDNLGGGEYVSRNQICDPRRKRFTATAAATIQNFADYQRRRKTSS
jgi:hypothetical protein